LGTPAQAIDQRLAKQTQMADHKDFLRQMLIHHSVQPFIQK
jgi:hypothetical protein